MPEKIIGVILAGGRSRRMSSGTDAVDKTFCELAGKTLIEHVIDRARGQVDQLIISSNSNDSRFGNFALPIVKDRYPGYLGPLAGILSAMEWVTQHHPSCQWLASFTTDSPFIPSDLIKRFLEVAINQQAPLVCAYSNGRSHSAIGLWSLKLMDDLRHQLLVKDERKVDRWTQRHNARVVEFDGDGIDPFFNINTRDDLQQAENFLRSISRETY